MSSTPTPTPTSTSTPTPTPTGPKCSSGYKPSDLWGATYSSHDVYVAKLTDSSSAESYGRSPAQYRGYSGGCWYDLTYDSSKNEYQYVTSGDTYVYGVYYSDESYIGGASQYVSPENLPSGYSKSAGYPWGETYDGRTVYICYKNDNGTILRKGHYKGSWFPIYDVTHSQDYADGSQMTTIDYYLVGSNELYYTESYYAA